MITGLVLGLTDEEKQTVKQDLITALTNGDWTNARVFFNNYSFITEKYDVEIFEGMLNCFNDLSKTGICKLFFKLLKLSLRDVSNVTTTPLIQAIEHYNRHVVDGLLKMPEVREFIDKTDHLGRTALMHAALKRSPSLMGRIIGISCESVNYRDFEGKTAFMYAWIEH